ncbi:MAG: hypothetical protein Salg2KO_21670 [Salibacteraceae bacterium]
MNQLTTKHAFDLIHKSGKNIDTHQFLFACRGNFNSSITDNILFLTEENLLALDSPKIAKKVYYLMVEGLQNITRHQHYNHDGSAYEGGLFIINRHINAYSVTYGNWVASNIKEQLEERLSTISNKEHAELKEYYLEILNNTSFSDKGGAGLGLVDMARKSSGKLNYRFVPVNDGFFYYLNLSIAIDKNTFDELLGEQYLNAAVNIHENMIEIDSQILFKGLLNEENVNHLSKQIDTAVTDETNNDGLGLVMTELLRNVAKHAYNQFNQPGKPGVFMLQRIPEGYCMQSGNYIHDDTRSSVERVVERINALSMEEITALLEQERDPLADGKVIGTGLMQLKQMSKHPIEHKIVIEDSHPPFFILQIQLSK